MFLDRIALVTGATSGIGKKIAQSLLEEGAVVFINFGHNEELREKTEEEFKQYPKAHYIKADVTDEEAVCKMFRDIKEKYGQLDYLINNAGTNIDDFVVSADMSSWDHVIKTNLEGKVIVAKHAIPLLKKGRDACVINIASSLGVRADKECSAYCCAAAGIIKFTECLALELADDLIRVNTVSPAFTPTPLSLAGWTEAEIEEKKKRNPRGRVGDVQDIANMVLFLLSPKADYINGENIRVNGGGLIR